MQTVGIGRTQETGLEETVSHRPVNSSARRHHHFINHLRIANSSVHQTYSSTNRLQLTEKVQDLTNKQHADDKVRKRKTEVPANRKREYESEFVPAADDQPTDKQPHHEILEDRLIEL